MCNEIHPTARRLNEGRQKGLFRPECNTGQLHMNLSWGQVSERFITIAAVVLEGADQTIYSNHICDKGIVSKIENSYFLPK